MRKAFSWQDIERECAIELDGFSLDKKIGARIHVPEALYNCYPYNATVYHFLQTLRDEIRDLGILHFPHLPFNKTNYTLAQGAPQQHRYSTNPYMTDWCQLPHQDTPPYPTAFGLEEERKYFATWILSKSLLAEFFELQRSEKLSLTDLHKVLVSKGIKEGSGLLLNQTPGLSIIDNTPENGIYHARTCNFAAIENNPDFETDELMYAFNEIGLLYYIDQLDSRRGPQWRDEAERQDVAFYFQNA